LINSVLKTELTDCGCIPEHPGGAFEWKSGSRALVRPNVVPLLAEKITGADAICCPACYELTATRRRRISLRAARLIVLSEWEE